MRATVKEGIRSRAGEEGSVAQYGGDSYCNQS